VGPWEKEEDGKKMGGGNVNGKRDKA